MAKFGEVFKESGANKQTARHPRNETKWIHYTKLTDNTKQYRKSATEEDIEDLAELIKSAGKVLQDLLVRKSGPDTYEIIAGHHRRLACKYLVEKQGLKEYEFLPCKIEDVDDVQAEFQLYATNGFMPKSDAEKLHEIERIKYLLETYPEQFKEAEGGRTVEKIARIMKMGKTTVGDYVTISNNLGDKAMEQFEKGKIKKSAALGLASLPVEEQDKLVDAGKTTINDIKAHKAEPAKKESKSEPSPREVKDFYNLFIKDFDETFSGRDELGKFLVNNYGKPCQAGTEFGITYECSEDGIRLNDSKWIKWPEFMDMIDGVTMPDRYDTDDMPVSENSMIGQYAFNDIDMETRLEEEDEQNYLDLPDDEWENGLHEMYDLNYFVSEQRELLKELKKLKAAGKEVAIKVMRRQEYIVEALELLANK